MTSRYVYVWLSVVVVLVAGCSPTAQEVKLLNAIWDEDVAEVSRLLDDGVNPNAYTELGTTMITEAAGQGNFEILELLEAAGANPRALSRDGESALSTVAALSGSVEVAVWLIDRGVDVCVPLSEGSPEWDKYVGVETLEGLARWAGNTDLADFLVVATAEC